MGCVATISGAVGGIGTSTLAFAFALQPQGEVLLIDAQPDGAPLDILLGSEGLPGARWSQVRVRSDAIDAETVLQALPEHRGVHLLSADRGGAADARALRFIVDAVREHCDLVVIDIPARDPALEDLRPDLRVVLLPPTITGLGAAMASPLVELFVTVDIGHADFAIGAAAEYLGREVLGPLRWQRSVTMAAAQCLPPPAASDVVQVADELWRRLADGL